MNLLRQPITHLSLFSPHLLIPFPPQPAKIKKEWRKRILLVYRLRLLYLYVSLPFPSRPFPSPPPSFCPLSQTTFLSIFGCLIFSMITYIIYFFINVYFSIEFLKKYSVFIRRNCPNLRYCCTSRKYNLPQKTN